MTLEKVERSFLYNYLQICSWLEPWWESYAQLHLPGGKQGLYSKLHHQRMNEYTEKQRVVKVTFIIRDHFCSMVRKTLLALILGD